MCLTTDCWRSSANESYLALTAHYMTTDFELQSVLLECAQIFDTHTSENLAKEIIRIVEEFSLKDKVILVVSDNVSNITSAVKKHFGWQHFGCYAHSLNLIVQSALSSPEINELKVKIKTVVSHLKRSSTATEKLVNYQTNSGVKVPLKLVQEVPTRWNSTFYVFKRFHDLQDAVKTSVALIDKGLPILSADDWRNCREIFDVLAPFEDTAKKNSTQLVVK